MIDHPEFAAYLVANIGYVAMSGFLAVLSFLAYYRRPGQLSYSIAGLGFACIGLAGLVESGYIFLVETNHVLSSTEFLVLQACDDVISAVGLGLFFLAITKHKPGSPEAENHEIPSDEESYWKSGKPFDD